MKENRTTLNPKVELSKPTHFSPSNRTPLVTLFACKPHAFLSPNLYLSPSLSLFSLCSLALSPDGMLSSSPTAAHKERK
ncbi:hypothetical protein DVH24_008534 [Malus domestica]|uniref:Uncharacterized protein n=1 Tax=Malus domestica TaxID=3750 RepID=A0A498JQA6_MALDO|nr:hypothetical protein DVH24_008534 [Malus domestica]